MLGRTLLPPFGGTAAVWTVCLAAYQTLLVAGYFYAHVIAKRPLRTQRTLHVSLLVLAALWTAGFAFGRPALRAFIGNSGAPALEVLFCVLVFAGLPYVLLSAGSTLVQAWLVGGEDFPKLETAKVLKLGSVNVPDSRTSELSNSRTSSDVYRLYAVSNLGSFCGLLAYPFILEPHVSLTVQWWGFAVCLAAYAVLLGRVAAACGVRSSTLDPRPSTLDARPSTRDARASTINHSPSTIHSPTPALLWFILPCLSVFMLNAITAHLTLEVLPLPLLWVALLGAFLLSYVFGFSDKTQQKLWAYQGVALLALMVLALSMKKTGGAALFKLNLAGGLALLFAGCTFLHGWLYRIRPQGAGLTRYYLANALGGAAGGITASLLMPMAFRRVVEYPLMLALVAAVIAAAGLFGRLRSERAAVLPWVAGVAGLAVTLGGIAYNLAFEDMKGRTSLYADRGFFGTIEVLTIPAASKTGTGALHEFIHGATVHGMQARIPGKERMPTAYFTPDSGGLAVVQHPKYKQGQPLRVAVVGMGIGVLTAYCRSNDFYRCYEISPEVVKVAQDPALFSFLADAPGRVEVILGDGRKELEKERSRGEERFDVIFVDAFTGDNLPYHLSTKEAFQLYLDRLADDGILAVNISNWHLDLLPLIRAVSIELDIPAVAFRQEGKVGQLRFGAAWAMMMRDPPADFKFPADAQMAALQHVTRMRLPTDEKGSFIGLVSWPWK
jgi:hypothetical protein